MTEPVHSEPEWKAGRKEYLIIISLSIVSMTAALEASIFQPILPAIADDLHGSATATFWVASAYLVPCTAFQPFMGSLSDIFGRRSAVFTSLFIFIVGSLVGVLSKTMSQLLAGRAIQGIGGSGMNMLPAIVMADIIPLRERPKYMSIVQLAMALGTILGPLLGGVFVQYSQSVGGWRWALYIDFPLCLLALMMNFLYLTGLRRRDGVVHSVDWVGGLLFTASVVSVLIAISWGGSQYPWDSYQTLLPLCLGIVGLFASILWERFGTSHPFLRLSLFNISSGAVYAGTVAQGILLFGTLYSGTLYIEAVQGLSAFLAGVGIIAILGIFLPISIVIAGLMSKTRRFLWALWIGWVLLVLTTGLLCLLDVHTSTGVWVGLLILVGLGHGVVYNALFFSAQALATGSDVPHAAGFYAFMRTLGFAIGAVLSGTVLQNVMASSLSETGLPPEIAANAEAYVHTLNSLPVDDAQKPGILRAYREGLQAVFAVFTGIGGLALFLSFLVPNVSLDRGIESDYSLDQPGDSKKIG